jgi:hypothetical protein
MKKITACLLMPLLWPFSANAYLEINHQDMVRNATRKSVLANDAKILKNMGFEPYGSNTVKYPGSDLVMRSVEETIAFGAWNEDNEGGLSGKVPWRPLHHFFNPQAPNGPLATQGLLSIMRSSPSWMFEDTTGPQGQTLGLAPTLEQQEFSYWDARKYQYCSVMGDQDYNCKLPNVSATGAELRKIHAGLMFQALGHLMHHVQDMAQPQHVRNDAHCHVGNVENGEGPPFDLCSVPEAGLNTLGIAAITGSIGTGFIPGALGGFYLAQAKVHEKSLYEALAGRIFPPFGANYIGYDGYTTPVMFAKPQDFWSNVNLSGMADFTSRNFVSEETQFRVMNASTAAITDPTQLHIGPAHEMAFPDGTNARIYAESATSLPGAEGVNGKVYFVEKKFTDPYNGQLVTVPRMSAVSMFINRVHGPGRDASENVKKLMFVQNPYTLLEHYKVLLPRAVAFSTGLINYFFRGKLDVEFSPSLENVEKHRIRFKNASTERMHGRISVWSEHAIQNWGAPQYLLQTDPIQLDPESWSSWYEIRHRLPFGTGYHEGEIRWMKNPYDVPYFITFDGALGLEGDADTDSNPRNVTTHTYNVPYKSVDLDLVPTDNGKYYLYNRSPYLLNGNWFLVDTNGSFNYVHVVYELAAGEKKLVSIGVTGAYQIGFAGSAGPYAAVSTRRTVELKATPLPVACSGPFTGQGGSAGQTRDVVLGSTAGKVKLEFETYDVPDTIEIFALSSSGSKGARLEYANMVRGFNALEFTHSPSDSVSNSVRIKVTGNTSGTEWNYTMGCPGKSIANGDRLYSRKTVSFHFGNFDVYDDDINCSFKLYIDYDYATSVSASTGSVYRPITLTQGRHHYEYKEVVCKPPTTALWKGGFQAEYSVGGQTIALKPLYPTYQSYSGYFDVN